MKVNLRWVTTILSVIALMLCSLGEPSPAISAPTKIGVYRNNITNCQLYRDMNGSGSWDSATDTFSFFGIPGDIPVTGDWDGTGTSRIGVFRNGQWYRDLSGNGSWDPATDAFTMFGIAGDLPVTGDWNGTGTTKIGVFRDGQWFQDLNVNGVWDPALDGMTWFGITGDIPVTGDWNGTGTTNIGVVRTSGSVLSWYLDTNGNGVWDQGIDKVYVFGTAGDRPVTGDWSGSGTTRIGVFRTGQWYLDMDGDGIWEPETNTLTLFGIPGDTPITGKWSPDSVPSRPANLTSVRGDSQITIYWNPSVDATSYTLYWSNTPNFSPLYSQKLSGITGTSYIHSGLANGSTYYYRVSASNSHGESYVSGVSSAVPGNMPVQPLNITVSPGSGTAGGGMAIVAWNFIPGATSYSLYWSTSPIVSTSTSNKISNIPVNGYTHTGLVPDVTYYYRVTASNASGESPLSPEIMIRLSQVIDLRRFRPQEFAITDTPLNVIATTYSTYEITSVVVQLGGNTYPLTYQQNVIYPNRPGWATTIPLTGMTRGAHAISVTATDAMGNSATVSTSFEYDQKPVLSVTSPLDYAVLRNPAVHVTAACTDDNAAGCASIAVYDANDRLLVTATGSNLDQTLTLNAVDGASVAIRIVATDSCGQTTSITRTVLIEALPGLTAATTVAGEIKDFTNDRILYAENATSLKIRSLNDSADTPVVSNSQAPLVQAGLTPAGAMYTLAGSNSTFGNIYDFRSGTSELLGVAGSAFKIADNFAIWCGDDQYLHLRNLASETNFTFGYQAHPDDNVVAANGDAVFRSANDIFRYRNGGITKITSTMQNYWPKTDGNLIAYVKRQIYPDDSEIYLYEGVSELLLSGVSNGLDPPLDYQVVNGWVAFARRGGTTNQGQIWLRSSTGVEVQVTFFSTTSTILALASNGELIVSNAGRLYLYKPGQSGLANVASANARPKYLNGAWHYVVGRTLFK